MGFVPLAYRAGSAGKGRVHIFWQKRVVEGDERTPWWYPSITGSGAIREDRLVLPIPEGQNWGDARPTVLPGATQGGLGSADDNRVRRARLCAAGGGKHTVGRTNALAAETVDRLVLPMPVANERRHLAA